MRCIIFFFFNFKFFASEEFEHTFKDSDAVRIHSIITKGGDLVNIVPDDVVLETLCRAKTLDAIRDAAFKTDRSFRAGARALGARCVIETMPGYLPSIPEQMPEEVVEVIREAAGDRPVEVLTPDVHTPISTDVGDLQHVRPVLTVRTGGCAGGLHQSDFRIEDEDEAYLLTAKLIALSAYRLLKDGARVGRRVKERYRPVFRTREEYTQYLEQFNTVTEDRKLRPEARRPRGGRRAVFFSGTFGVRRQILYINSIAGYKSYEVAGRKQRCYNDGTSRGRSLRQRCGILPATERRILRNAESR